MKGDYADNIPDGFGPFGRKMGVGTGNRGLSFTPDPGGTLPPAAGSATAAAAAGMGGEAIAVGGLIGGVLALSYTIGNQFYESAAIPGSVGNGIAEAIAGKVEAPYRQATGFLSRLLQGKPGDSKGGQVIQGAKAGQPGQHGQVPGAIYNIRFLKSNGESGYVNGQYAGPIQFYYYPNVPPQFGNATDAIISASNTLFFRNLSWNGSWNGITMQFKAERADGTSEADDIAADPSASPPSPEVKKASGTVPVRAESYGPWDTRTPPNTNQPPSSQSPPAPPKPPTPPTIAGGNFPDRLPKKGDNKFGRVSDVEWDKIATDMVNAIKAQPGNIQKRKGEAPQRPDGQPIAPYLGKKPEYPPGIVEPGNGQSAKLPPKVTTPTLEKRPDPITTPALITPIAPYIGKKTTPTQSPTQSPKPQNPVPAGGRSTTPAPIPTPTKKPTPTAKPRKNIVVHPSDLKPKPNPFPEFDWKTGTYPSDSGLPKPKPDPKTDRTPKFDWKTGEFVDPGTIKPKPEPKTTPTLPGFPPVLAPPIIDRNRAVIVDPVTAKPVQPEPQPNKGIQLPPTTEGGNGGGTCAYPGYHPQVMGGHTATQTEVGAVNTLISAETNVAVRAAAADVTAVKNAIGSPVIEGMETVFKGVEKIKDLTDKIIKSDVVDRALNLMILATSLHNAMMLSRSLATTLTETLQNILTAVGIKDANGTPFDLNAIFSKQLEDLIKGIVGTENYAQMKAVWVKANRILTTASNLLDAVRAEHSAIMSGVEVVANVTSELSNAAKLEGLFNDDLLDFQPENHNFKQPFGRTQLFLQNLTEAAEQINQLASAVIEGQEAATEINKNWDEFKKETSDLKLAKATTEATKDAQNVPPDTTLLDYVMYEPEILGG